MLQRMIESTFSSSNVYKVVDDNSNSDRNIVMDVMRINRDYAYQNPIIDEESNVNTTNFSFLFKDPDEPLRNECTNHNKLSFVA